MFLLCSLILSYAHGFYGEFCQGTAGMAYLCFTRSGVLVGEELRVQVVLGRLHFHIWYLEWVDLMTRTADCSTSPWSLASSQDRVIGFLILHTEIPNMYFSEQGRSWIAFMTQPWVISAVFYGLKQSESTQIQKGERDFNSWWIEGQRIWGLCLK